MGLASALPHLGQLAGLGAADRGARPLPPLDALNKRLQWLQWLQSSSKSPPDSRTMATDIVRKRLFVEMIPKSRNSDSRVLLEHGDYGLFPLMDAV